MPPIEDKDLARIAIVVVCGLITIVGCGTAVILRNSASMQKHMLQIMGLALLAPAVILVSYFKVIQPEATAALLGAMVAFLGNSAKDT